MTNKHEQLSFEEEHRKADNEPVVCLGMTFKNDDDRREYFRNELRKKLPELKKIEGFPIGEDEDIIELSDPPYYTACPNPWINDLVNNWNSAREYPENKQDYNKKPYASDVSEGKNNAVYNAHGYHTKVPYKAVMRYILHYTNPGDIVFDGFSGTGMTGVAARRCNNKELIESLGYNVKGKKIFQDNVAKSELGSRYVILNDLSTSASMISYNYNVLGDQNAFFEEANRILLELKQNFTWIYEVNHNDSKGIINNVVWSDIFVCSNCSEEIVYWDAVVDIDKKRINSRIITCSKCNTQFKRNELERAWELVFDPALNKTIKQIKQVPTYMFYSVGTRRYERKVDKNDLDKIKKIENTKVSSWYPIARMPEGDESRRNDRIGYTHVHHYFTKRNLLVLAEFYKRASKSKFFSKLLFFFQASINRATKTNRFRFGGTGGLSGTLYIPSLPVERNVIRLLENKLRDYKRVYEEESKSEYISAITTQTTTNSIKLESNTVDYIFTDPPFGKNLMYSELNFIWESWLKVLTNNTSEAIINSTQKKGLLEYQRLMEESFLKYYRVLKPGRWMTVEFSNSQSSVWNAIQSAIQKAGFVIADVSALDKKQGSFKAVTTTTAVKQDLIISAYKPHRENIKEIHESQNTKDSSWLFISQHLEKLPVFMGEKGGAEIISERTPRILFDRMVAYHVQNGLPVPISSAEFQAEVAQRFPVRDGMIFLESQVAEYDKKRILVKEFSQMNLFVSDENSAIEWLRQQLMKKPQSRQDIHPNFMKEIQHIERHELLPELDDLLNQNFLIYEGEGAVPDQIVAYFRRNFKNLRGLEPDDEKVIEKAMNRWYVPDPNKQADLERLRERALLREFEGYLQELESHRRQLRQFRTEAVRAGFKKAYSDRNFEQIVQVGDRLPKRILEADDKLLMYYDNASIRLGM